MHESIERGTPPVEGVKFGNTRRAFLKQAGVGGAAVLGGGALLGAVAGPARAGHSDGVPDVDILNFALTLEYLEAEFYKQGIALGLGAEAEKLAKLLGDQEQQHVEALAGTVEKLGGTAAKKPSFTFPIKDEASFLKLAQTLEDTGVSAYNGAAPAISSGEVLGAAGSIVQIEARHAALIRLERGKSPAPVAFDKPSEMEAVLKAVTPFIKA